MGVLYRGFNQMYTPKCKSSRDCDETLLYFTKILAFKEFYLRSKLVLEEFTFMGYNEYVGPIFLGSWFVS